MRFLIVSLALLPAAAAAQLPGPAWSLAPSATLVSFSAAGSELGSGSRVQPARSTAVGVGLTRRVGSWEIRASADALTSHLEVVDEGVAVELRGAALTRRRFGLAVRRAAAQIGSAAILLGVGPTIETWSPEGFEGRTAVGLEGSIALRLDAGPFAVENAVALGFSDSPLGTEDLPEGYTRRAFRTVSYAVTMRFGL